MDSKQLWQAFSVASTLVGGVIGAGFASGQEIVSFFDPLGPASPAGLASAAIVLAAGGLLIVRAASVHGLSDYGQLFRASAGPRFGAAVDVVVSTFLFLTLAVTLAGGAAILRESYQVAGAMALGITCLAGCVLVAGGPSRLFAINSLLVPLLVAVLLAVISIPSPPSVAPAPASRHACLTAAASGCLYGAYNLILGAGILVAGARYGGKAAALIGAVAGAGTLIWLASRVLGACRLAGPEVLRAQIPVAALAALGPPAAVHLYAVVLSLAVLTTAGCVAVSLAERCRFGRLLGRVDLGPPLLIVAAIPLATWGFARLVRTVYPAMGLVGLCWLAVLAIEPFGQE
jgi:uncharacterized membrane protein YkvI